MNNIFETTQAPLSPPEGGKCSVKDMELVKNLWRSISPSFGGGRGGLSFGGAMGGLIALFFLLFISCQNATIQKEKPKDLLEQTVFESLLMELYLIEGDARSQLRNPNFDSLRTKITNETNAMYTNYNTDHEQFLKSYAYYMRDAALSKAMMENIVNQLVELQAKEEAKQRETDSIASKTFRYLSEILPPAKLRKYTKNK